MADPSAPADKKIASSDPHVHRWEPVRGNEAPTEVAPKVREIGGRKDGPEPTRYGDWEKNGRCIDF